MRRTTGRLLAGTTVTAGLLALAQASASAVPPETFSASWGSVGGCYARTATATVTTPEVGENILVTLYVTVGQKTYAGATYNTGVLTDANTVSHTVSVSAPCTATGQAVYDLYIQGYKNAPAIPDYLIDQAHAFSVCNDASTCVDSPVGAPLDLNVPPAPYIGHL